MPPRRLRSAFCPVIRLALSLTASCLATPSVRAEETVDPVLSVSGGVRIRSELLSGQYRPGLPAQDRLVSIRTDLAARLQLGAVTLVGEVIDARGYAQNPISSVRTPEVNAVEPVQAYLAARIAPAGTITVGKFTMDIGSSRLVGRTDFPNGVSSFGGAMLDWRDSSHRLRLFWTHPLTALPNDPAAIRDNRLELDRMANNIVFFGSSGTIALHPDTATLEVYAYRFVERDHPARMTRGRRLVTIGARMRRAPTANMVDYEVEGAWQGGRTRLLAADVPTVPVRAGFAHVEGGWTLGSGWMPRVSAMVDYASGDGGSGTSYGRFDTLYGARRGDFGPLSLFGPLGRANLISPAIRVEAAPSKRLDLMASVRPAWLARATDSFAATSVKNRDGENRRYGGTQFEIRARRWLRAKQLRVELGGGYLIKGDLLRHAPGVSDSRDTRYLHTDLFYRF